MGVDVGTVRVGVAASDPDGIMAFPVATVPRSETAVAEVVAIADERAAIEIFVGLPKMLKGHEGQSAADARAFAEQIAELTRASVRLVDERFSTTTASSAMREAGRTARQQRQQIDQAAAVVILEGALDIARAGNLDKVTQGVSPKERHD